MRLRRTAALLLAPLVLAGCATTGSPSSAPSPVGDVQQLRGGEGWMVIDAGKATATPTAAARGTYLPSPPPTVSPEPVDTSCAFNWLAGQVLIPVTVSFSGGTATVSWPRVGDPPPNSYRVAVVPQDLVGGRQPEPVWKTVTATSGCAASTTYSGLTPGAPYIFWLDAPGSGYQPDGTPRPRHGRSTVVYAP